MILQSLKQHFPARAIEWLNAGALASWGLYVLLHPQMFTNPATRELFAGLTEITWGLTADPALLWGLTALLVGLARAVALFVNGAYGRTPLVRLGTSFASAFIWTQVIIGLMHSGVPNTGLVVYSWLVVADIISAYRASQDAVYAEKQRRDSWEFSGRAVNRRIIA